MINIMSEDAFPFDSMCQQLHLPLSEGAPIKSKDCVFDAAFEPTAVVVGQDGLRSWSPLNLPHMHENQHFSQVLTCVNRNVCTEHQRCV